MLWQKTLHYCPKTGWENGSGPVLVHRQEQIANLGTSPLSRSRDQRPSREASCDPVWRTPPARHAALIVCQLSRSGSDKAASCMCPARPHQMHAHGQARHGKLKRICEIGENAGAVKWCTYGNRAPSNHSAIEMPLCILRIPFINKLHKSKPAHPPAGHRILDGLLCDGNYSPPYGSACLLI